MLYELFAQRHGNRVPDLLACRHEASVEDKFIWKGLDTGGLTDSNAVIQCWMNEATFRRIDAGSCHRRSRLQPGAG